MGKKGAGVKEKPNNLALPTIEAPRVEGLGEFSNTPWSPYRIPEQPELHLDRYCEDSNDEYLDWIRKEYATKIFFIENKLREIDPGNNDDTQKEVEKKKMKKKELKKKEDEKKEIEKEEVQKKELKKKEVEELVKEIGIGSFTVVAYRVLDESKIFKKKFIQLKVEKVYHLPQQALTSSEIDFEQIVKNHGKNLSDVVATDFPWQEYKDPPENTEGILHWFKPYNSKFAVYALSPNAGTDKNSIKKYDTNNPLPLEKPIAFRWLTNKQAGVCQHKEPNLPEDYYKYYQIKDSQCGGETVEKPQCGGKTEEKSQCGGETEEKSQCVLFQLKTERVFTFASEMTEDEASKSIIKKNPTEDKKAENVYEVGKKQQEEEIAKQVENFKIYVDACLGWQTVAEKKELAARHKQASGS